MFDLDTTLQDLINNQLAECVDACNDIGLLELANFLLEARQKILDIFENPENWSYENVQELADSLGKKSRSCEYLGIIKASFLLAQMSVGLKKISLMAVNELLSSDK